MKPDAKLNDTIFEGLKDKGAILEKKLEGANYDVTIPSTIIGTMASYKINDQADLIEIKLKVKGYEGKTYRLEGEKVTLRAIASGVKDVIKDAITKGMPREDIIHASNMILSSIVKYMGLSEAQWQWFLIDSEVSMPEDVVY